MIEAVARLNQAGARVVLTTNQSGVARGLITTAALDAIHARLRALLEAGGASLDAIYYCPHHPDDACSCRKPRTGLVDRAVGDLGLDPSRAYVVGDQNRDMELARKIGARSVLVTTGPTSQEALTLSKSNGLRPDRVATGHYARVRWDDARGRWLLLRGKDRNKDQSYFLFGLTQDQLSKTVFPLGELTKPEVREIARRAAPSRGKSAAAGLASAPPAASRRPRRPPLLARGRHTHPRRPGRRRD